MVLTSREWSNGVQNDLGTSPLNVEVVEDLECTILLQVNMPREERVHILLAETIVQLVAAASLAQEAIAMLAAILEVASTKTMLMSMIMTQVDTVMEAEVVDNEEGDENFFRVD